MIRKPKHPIRRLLWGMELYCSAVHPVADSRALRAAARAIEPLLKALDELAHPMDCQPDTPCKYCQLLAAWRAKL